MDKFQCLAGQEIFSNVPRPAALPPTLPRAHRVPGVGSLVVKQPEPKADNSFLSGTAVKNARSYTSAPPHIVIHFNPDHTNIDRICSDCTHSTIRTSVMQVFTRQAMYVQRTSEARSRNNCCRGKAISITYSECISVALVNQHANRTRRNVVCVLSGSAIFFHIIS
jgi:hypothetical protein